MKNKEGKDISIIPKTDKNTYIPFADCYLSQKYFSEITRINLQILKVESPKRSLPTY